MKTPKPKYPRPTRNLLDQAVRMASKFASFDDPRLVILATSRIVPRETILLEGELVDLMREAPETVPPIVVAPWGDVHVVVDGHHRLAGSLEAGLDSIWAVEVDLEKLKNFEWQAWY